MTPKEHDEIEALLEEVESDVRLVAPKNFKTEVLGRIAGEKRHRQRQMQREFRLKVCVGMAAALLMLFTLNLDETAQKMAQMSTIRNPEKMEEDYRKERQRVERVTEGAKKEAEKKNTQRKEEVRKQLEGEEERKSIFDMLNFDFLNGGK